MSKTGLFFCLFFMLLPLTDIRAQDLKLVDALDGTPVQGVHILVEGQEVIASDERGIADISSVAEDKWLMLTHASYVDTSLIKSELGTGDLMIALIPAVITMPVYEFHAAREKAIDVPQRVQSISLQEVQRTEPRTTADLLEKSGSIFVQRSQLGGGSPVIRGFEANRILLVIDGVRMNNAIYRGGHLQNVITVDPNILGETEIIYGPGSLIYGSDALGGVIHFKTKRPELSAEGTRLAGFSAMTRYSSASEEKTGHFDFNLAGEHLSWISSVSFSDFGDLEMGARRTHGNDDWGLVPFYIDRVNGQDSILSNPDPNVQIGTGYSQLDLHQKLLFQATDSIVFQFGVQFSTSSDVPRFDRLNDVDDDGLLRFAEWGYGPQNRLLTHLTADIISDSKVFDKAQIVAAFQRIDEDRINRRYQRDFRTIREEDVHVYSVNADFHKLLKKRDLYYGLQMTSNTVWSDAVDEDVLTGETTPSATRYPDGGSSMSTIEAYISQVNALSKKFRLNTGLRYSHIYLSSDFKDDTFYELPFDRIEFDNGAFTGSLGGTWSPSDDWKFDLLTSTGFRSPNVDDYGKVFERDGLVVVPTDELTPEYTVNGELGISTKAISDIRFDLTIYYTHILDAIVQRESTLNGSDSLEYEGELARIITNLNASEARIHGIDLGISARISEHWSADINATYTVGEDLESDQPLAHIPPLFGRLRLFYENGPLDISLRADYSSDKGVDDIAPGRTDNPSEGLEGGFPSWWTLGWSSSYTISEHIGVRFSIENILDEHYKTFASGISAPGRNFIFSLRYGL